MSQRKCGSLVSVSLMLCACMSMAQAQPQAATGSSPAFYATPYGPPVTVDAAKKAAAAALAEARKNNWLMAIAVVDPSGTLVYYEKMDNVQNGSAKVAINKARSAALYKRPTKLMQDSLASGAAGLRVFALEGAVPAEGGVPLIVDGKIIGAIGLSGDLGEHDSQCAAAGAAALKQPIQ
jgi:glc operon protein GlcG